MRSVSNKDAIIIRLWHMLVVSWAGFSNQTTMLAITWGTKNEGSFVRLARLARNTAQTAKLLLVQINSKTQASQLEMCILTYRRHWRMSRHPVLVCDNARAPSLETPPSAHAAH